MCGNVGVVVFVDAAPFTAFHSFHSFLVNLRTNYFCCNTALCQNDRKLVNAHPRTHPCISISLGFFLRYNTLLSHTLTLANNPLT